MLGLFVRTVRAMVTVGTILHLAFTSMTRMCTMNAVLVRVAVVMPVTVTMIVPAACVVDIRGSVTHHMRAVHMLRTLRRTTRTRGAVVPARNHKITTRLPAH